MNYKKEVVSYCQEHNVLLEAYSPLGTGKIFDVPEMQELSEQVRQNDCSNRDSLVFTTWFLAAA